MELTREVVGTPPPSQAKYEWLKSVLIDYIDQHLSPGNPVPSERELAENLDLSRMTARHAINDLVAEGRIRRVPGLGSFVQEATITLPLRLTSFTQDMSQRSSRAGSQTLEASTVPATEDLMAALDIEPGQPILRMVRLRTSDAQPVAIERVHLVADLVPGLADVDLTNASLYATLASRYGIVFDGAEQVIAARPVGATDAQRLEIHEGDAVLNLRRTSTWRGRRVEYTTSIYRGDRYELTTKL